MHKNCFNIGTNFLLIFCGLLFKLFGNIYWFRVFLLFLHWPLIIMNIRSVFQVNKITNDSVQNKQAYKNNFCCLKKQKFILKNTIYCRYVNQINFASVSGVGVNCSTIICSTLLGANQLLDTKFINCSNPVNPG
jgi:hypothetical protein